MVFANFVEGGTGTLPRPGHPTVYARGGRAGGAGRCRKPMTNVMGAPNRESPGARAGAGSAYLSDFARSIASITI